MTHISVGGGRYVYQDPILLFPSPLSQNQRYGLSVPIPSNLSTNGDTYHPYGSSRYVQRSHGSIDLPTFTVESSSTSSPKTCRQNPDATVTTPRPVVVDTLYYSEMPNSTLYSPNVAPHLSRRNSVTRPADGGRQLVEGGSLLQQPFEGSMSFSTPVQPTRYNSGSRSFYGLPFYGGVLPSDGQLSVPAHSNPNVRITVGSSTPTVHSVAETRHAPLSDVRRYAITSRPRSTLDFARFQVSASEGASASTSVQHLVSGGGWDPQHPTTWRQSETADPAGRYHQNNTSTQSSVEVLGESNEDHANNARVASDPQGSSPAVSWSDSREPVVCPATSCRLRVRSRQWRWRGTEIAQVDRPIDTESSSSVLPPVLGSSSAPMTFIAATSSASSGNATLTPTRHFVDRPRSTTPVGNQQQRQGREPRQEVHNRAGSQRRYERRGSRASARVRRSHASETIRGGLDYDGLLNLQERVGHVRRGLSTEQIELLPEETFQWTTSESKQRECLICKNEYEPEERLRRLPCWHVFHTCCIDKWLLGRKTCPLCRFEVEQALQQSSVELLELSVLPEFAGAIESADERTNEETSNSEGPEDSPRLAREEDANQSNYGNEAVLQNEALHTIEPDPGEQNTTVDIENRTDSTDRPSLEYISPSMARCRPVVPSHDDSPLDDVGSANSSDNENCLNIRIGCRRFRNTWECSHVSSRSNQSPTLLDSARRDISNPGNIFGELLVTDSERRLPSLDGDGGTRASNNICVNSSDTYKQLDLSPRHNVKNLKFNEILPNEAGALPESRTQRIGIHRSWSMGAVGSTPEILDIYFPRRNKEERLSGTWNAWESERRCGSPVVFNYETGLCVGNTRDSNTHNFSSRTSDVSPDSSVYQLQEETISRYLRCSNQSVKPECFCAVPVTSDGRGESHYHARRESVEQHCGFGLHSIYASCNNRDKGSSGVCQAQRSCNPRLCASSDGVPYRKARSYDRPRWTEYSADSPAARRNCRAASDEGFRYLNSQTDICSQLDVGREQYGFPVGVGHGSSRLQTDDYGRYDWKRVAYHRNIEGNGPASIPHSTELQEARRRCCCCHPGMDPSASFWGSCAASLSGCSSATLYSPQALLREAHAANSTDTARQDPGSSR